MKHILIALAVLAFLAAPAMAVVPPSVPVIVTVEKFAEVVLPTGQTLTNTITDLQDVRTGAYVNFTVHANTGYTVWGKPCAYVVVPAAVTGQGVDIAMGEATQAGVGNVGYFLMIFNGAGQWQAGLRYAPALDNITDSSTGFNTGAAPTGGAGITNFKLNIAGKANNTADGSYAAPGTYSGNVEIIVSVS